MRFQKAVLLFEVTLVVLLVSIASLFLFRGYSVFLRSGRKSSDYLRLSLLFEEKIWDLQMKEDNNQIDIALEKQGKFNSHYSWQLTTEDTEYQNLKRGVLQVNYEGRKSKVSLDTINYLIFADKQT